MLNSTALFLNGVYEAVLEEILLVQASLPEQSTFLQPYSGHIINVLRDDPPSVENPTRLFVSTTSNLGEVCYQAEIIRWENKRSIRHEKVKEEMINRLITALQPNEKDLYKASKGSDDESVNLLYVRRLQRLDVPFTVSRLRKKTDGEPLKPRKTSGGWSYIDLEPIQTED